MPNSADGTEDRERRLDAIIAEYYRTAENGNAPDQSHFIAGYPDFQLELSEFFSNIGIFKTSGHSELENSGLDSTAMDIASQQKVLTAGAVVRYFGDYEILEILGAGGMGVVYKALHVRLRKLVALKMIRAGEFATDLEVKMFQSEARAAAKLDHPGIVAVHEVGMHDGQHYYTMDFVSGGSLSQLQRGEPVTARRAADLVRQLAEAMHYAHGKGIVHRDLKPANILLTANGAPKIADFGLAKRFRTDDESQALTITDSDKVFGTYAYMSTEQATGKSHCVGPLSDVYSLGAVLYQLLTGRAPFVGETPPQVIMQVLHTEPVSPRILNPSIPRDLETICLKCLQKESSKRYGTAQLLADDLAFFQEGKPVMARPISSIEQCWRWCKRNTVIASLSAVLFASLMIGIGVSWYFKFRSDNFARDEKESRLLAEKRKEDLEDILREMEQVLIESDAKALQISQRNYALLLAQAPNLWSQSRIDDLKALLDEANTLDLAEFGAAYWSEKIKAARPLASLTIPAWKKIAFSRDGKWAAIARTHNDDVGRPENVYKRSVADLYRIIHSPNASSKIRFEHQKTFALPIFGVSEIAFVPGTRMLALITGKTDIKLLDLDSGELTLAFKVKYTMYGVKHFSAMGSHLLNFDGDENRWEIWSINDQSVKSLPKLEEFSSQQARLALSDDGEFVASTTGLVIQVDGGGKIHQLKGLTQCWDIKFSPDNRFLCASRQDGRQSSLSFWSHAKEVEIFSLANVGSYAFSHSNPDICFVVSEGVLHRVDLAQRVSVRLDTVGWVSHLSLIPGNESVVLGVSSVGIAAWKASKSSATSTLQFPRDIRAVSPNRQYALVPGTGLRVIEVWDLFERKKIAEMTEPNLLLTSRTTQRPERVTYAISDFAVVASHVRNQSQVMLFDARQNKHAESWNPRIRMPPRIDNRVGITPNGETLLLIESGLLHGVSFKQREAWTLQVHSKNFSAFAISPDSKWIVYDGECLNLVKQTKVKLPAAIEAFCMGDRSLGGHWVTLNGESWLAGPLGMFFNPATGDLLQFASMTQQFRGLAVSPDGRNLAAVSESSPQVRVFIISKDNQDPRLWPVLELESSPSFQCGFLPDSRTLLTVGQNTVTYIHADHTPD